MTNKAIAEKILKGKTKSHRVGNLKLATAIRVAAHRLGGVITVQTAKGGFTLTKSAAKVSHRKRTKATKTRAKLRR